MFKQTIIAISLFTSLIATQVDDFQKQKMQDFNNYKKSQKDAFNDYKEAQIKTFNDYKNEIGEIWQKPKLSTAKSWVSYSKDKRTRSDVDFSKEIIIIETIALSQEEAKRNLQTALAKTVTTDTKSAHETDPLEIRLSKINLPSGVADDKVDKQPILSTVIFEKKPTKQSINKYVNKNITTDKITIKKSNKIKHANIYSISIKLPPDTMIKRSKVYYDEVKLNANKRNLPLSLVFAVMHSESSFNPRARSHIPAYGLMQIVPHSAGRDSYKFLYKKDKLVSGNYLYNSSNNIKMGSAYLHILYYRYLKKIKNPDSRLYCTIAAYNTGAGNIAYAFTRTYNMNKATPLINAMSPKEVYNKLMKDLRFDEPKHYLKKVTSRMAGYHKVYGS